MANFPQLLPILQPIGALSHKALLSVATPVREQTPTREGDDEKKFSEKCELLFLKTEALSQPACTLPKLIG